MSAKRYLFIPALFALMLGAGSARAETIQVTIEKFAFSPAEITANVGDTIEWINKDAMAHTATVKDSWEVMVPAKQTVSQVLETAEAVDYFCRFHPSMKGKLAVTAP